MNDIASRYITVSKEPHGHEARGFFLGFPIHAHGLTEGMAISKAADQMREILRQYKAARIANIRARYPNFQMEGAV